LACRSRRDGGGCSEKEGDITEAEGSRACGAKKGLDFDGKRGGLMREGSGEGDTGMINLRLAAVV